MSEPRHRKLAAMGIASLVSTGRDEVLDRLPTEICNMWLDVFGEIREAAIAADEYVFQVQFSRCVSDAKMNANSESASTLLLYWDKVPDTFYRETEGTAEYDRRKAVRRGPLPSFAHLTADCFPFARRRHMRTTRCGRHSSRRSSARSCSKRRSHVVEPPFCNRSTWRKRIRLL